MPHRQVATFDAILLDRDGVINRERSDYVKSWEEFEFLPGALLALKRLAAYPWPIIVITNQSAVGRELISEADLVAIHARMIEAVYQAGGRIDAIFACPHRPEDHCDCRKPRPGLLLQAAQSFQAELRRCIFIGNALTDYQAAAAVNCPTILVNSGEIDAYTNVYSYVYQGRQAQPPVLTLPDLLSAVATIIDAIEEQSKVGN